MKLVLLTFVAVAALMFCLSEVDTTAHSKKNPVAAERARTGAARQAKLLATPMVLIDKKKTSNEQRQKSMPLHKEKPRSRSTAYDESSKDPYEKNLISKKIDLESNARIPTITHFDAERLRERVPQDDLALSRAEEATDEEWHSKFTPIRYEGGANWSPEALEKISSFFRQRYSRPLPISARGQSDTHNRLGLDHRDSVDVALRPDSTEGRDLIAYLRSRGIPFIAFNGKLSSISTGAHIHIGRPSPRLIQVEQQVRPAQQRNDRADTDDG